MMKIRGNSTSDIDETSVDFETLNDMHKGPPGPLIATGFADDDEVDDYIDFLEENFLNES